jgi:tight adherence protein B
MFQILVFVSLFVCFASLAGGIALVLRSKQESGQFEDRLANMTANRGRGGNVKEASTSVLAKPLEDAPGKIEEFLGEKLNLGRMISQAGIKNLSAGKFLAICSGLGIGSTMLYLISSPMKSVAPLVFICTFFLPFLFVLMKKKKRMKMFSSQLADAMDVLSRALRSGYSMPAGLQLIGTQMAEPLGPEFAKCFEQQNLGMSVEESIRDMTERVGNVDLRFFATAVILQRQTGGDLAEILDKISHLIRERFKIWGQIQALTGEGRLSGIVLLALPPVLFVTMLKLNYDYIMMLFNDPLGQKMLAFGIFMQVIGAICIKKIITIKV